jgi:hypothetical protein
MPLVNVRYTLRAMRLAGYVSRTDEQNLLGYMRNVPWFDRDRHSLSGAVYATCGRSRSVRIMQTFDLMYCDIKKADALSLVAKLSSQECAR